MARIIDKKSSLQEQRRVQLLPTGDRLCGPVSTQEAIDKELESYRARALACLKARRFAEARAEFAQAFLLLRHAQRTNAGFALSLPVVTGLAYPLPETTALVSTFRTLTRERSYLAGTAALLAYEAQVPAVAVAKLDGLKRFYGVTDPRGLAFFQVHVQADRYHADTGWQILRDHVKPDQAMEVVTACEQALAALWGMLDGVYVRYC